MMYNISVRMATHHPVHAGICASPVILSISGWKDRYTPLISRFMFIKSLTLTKRVPSPPLTPPPQSDIIHHPWVPRSIINHLSSLMTSTKWTSLFSLKFLARSWISAEWSIPGPAAPGPPVMPKLVPVPVLVLVFFSFSWSMSHRELWLARTGSSNGGLRRPLAALGLWPGMNYRNRRRRWRKWRGWEEED